MQEESEQVSILAILLRTFEQAPHSRQFNRVLELPLQLFVVERQDRNLCYLTDGKHTILGLSSRKKPEIAYHPLNKLSSHFYIFRQQTYKYLNFTCGLDEPDPQQINPYNPHYYLKERYEEFLNIRKQLALPNPCQVLSISKWELALVNISTIGYYAPVIVIHQFKKSSSKNPPRYLDLNCILYEPEVQQKMETYRLADMRQHFACRLPKTLNTSLFYLARRMQLKNGKIENNSIVSIGRNKKILQYRQSQPHFYIICSDFLEGVCSVSNPLKEAINAEDIEIIQTRHLNELFNGLNLSEEKKLMLENRKQEEERAREEKQQRRRQKNLLWSDTSSEEEKDIQARNEAAAVPEEESEEEEDHLRALYKKQLNKQK